MSSISKHIAVSLKSLRQKYGWSLSKTAEETGVSKAMLGQIEREESSPTIATLWKIASGFNVSFSYFIEDIHTTTKNATSYSNSIQDFNPADEKIHITSLFSFDEDLGAEIFIIELLPTCEHLSPPHAPGVVEHVIVTEGVMEVLLNGVWQTLTKGEGVRFNANQVHGYRNVTAETACFHNIIHYPRS